MWWGKIHHKNQRYVPDRSPSIDGEPETRFCDNQKSTDRDNLVSIDKITLSGVMAPSNH